MAVLPTGIGPVTGGYQIERSLRFNSADSTYLNRTPASASNQKTWTWSGWVKRSTLGALQGIFNPVTGGDGSNESQFKFNADDTIQIYDSGAARGNFITTQIFRDVSAWYHIVVALDTTQATSTNRFKLYVNGVQVTAFSTASYPSQNTDWGWNRTVRHDIGRYAFGSTQYFNGYMTEINFVDGQALTPSDFGETDANTGVWKPKAYTGTYGTNGFYLKFADNSGTTSTTLGKDSSGNGNNWTPNNFSVTAGAGNDSLVDSPTSYGTDTGVGGEVRGNYCTLNPLVWNSANIVNGALDITTASTMNARGTFDLRSCGKSYFEFAARGVNYQGWGVEDERAGQNFAMGNVNAYLWGCYNTTTMYSIKNSGATNTGIAPPATGGVNCVAFDAATGKLWLGYAASGTSTPTWFGGGDPAAGTSPFDTLSLAYGIFPHADIVGGGGTQTCSLNAGQRAFNCTAPSGFKALCTQNLPTPTIGATSTTQANDYFNAITYTGDGTASRYITGVGFQPDFVWIKNRTVANFHQLHDAVRGATVGMLASNSTNAEDSAYPLTSFNADGFTTKSGAQDGTNNSGSALVAWNWKANGAGSSNTAGTITSTVSANTTSGFSIVTYTGNGSSNQTIGHGLGVTPGMILVKARTQASATNWRVWHKNLSGSASYLGLNQTAAESISSTVFNGQSSTTFTVGTDPAVNANTYTFVAYCFAPVAGYSAFGSYTGNGSTDGPFVYLGFRPKFVMIKRTNTTEDWMIWDTSRSPYNAGILRLYPNTAGAENSTDLFDILSNGFKCRDNDTVNNASGSTYIYAAFAENPFKYSLAR